MLKHNTKIIMITALACCLISGFGNARQSGAQETSTSANQNLDDILKKLAVYDGGLDSGAFWDLRNYVLARKDAPEARSACEEKLLAFLQTKATPIAKMAVCRELRIIGSERSVPALEELLLQKDTTDMARYALEKIPGEAADKALLRALANSKGDIKIGIISSLGMRKTQSAVAPLGMLIADSKKEIASATAISLGRIGGKEAAGLLSSALPNAKPELQGQMASALFLCAEDFRAAKNDEAASGIYNRLLGSKLPVDLRRSAMAGKIATSGDQAAKLILSTLDGPDKDMQMPAIGRIKSVFNASNIASVCALLPKLPEPSQVQLLAVLANYPKEAVLAAILAAAQSPQLDVRIAGLKALEKTGDSSTVKFLAEAAAKSQRTEQEIARTSLWGLKGRDVDEEILSLASKPSSDDILNELLMSIGERRIFAGKAWLVKNEESSSPAVRQTALRALKLVGTPSDIPGLLDVLLRTSGEPDQIEVENTIGALAKKIASPLARSGAVKSRLDQETDIHKKSRLYRVLSKIGDDSSLPLLRKALSDPNVDIVDAAVRAFASWPTATAKDDVLQINQTTKNEIHEILTLQAYVRLIGLEKYRAPEAAVKDLKVAYGLADRPEEKKLVLGMLPNFACPSALDFAQSLLDFQDVKAEAQAAVDKIKKKLEPEGK